MVTSDCHFPGQSGKDYSRLQDTNPRWLAVHGDGQVPELTSIRFGKSLQTKADAKDWQSFGTGSLDRCFAIEVLRIAGAWRKHNEIRVYLIENRLRYRSANCGNFCSRLPEIVGKRVDKR